MNWGILFVIIIVCAFGGPLVIEAATGIITHLWNALAAAWSS